MLYNIYNNNGKNNTFERSGDLPPRPCRPPF